MEEDECDYVATEKEIRECELDIVAGEKVDSLWLILDNKYILIKTVHFKLVKPFGNAASRLPFPSPLPNPDTFNVPNSESKILKALFWINHCVTVH